MTAENLLRMLFDNLKGFELDQHLVKSFQLGLVLGICVTTALAFFPGKPELDSSYGASSTEEGFSSPTDNREQLKNGISGDNNEISHEGFASEEELLAFKRLVEQRRGQGEGSWTPHQQMNLVVYMVLFGIAYAVLKFSYDDEKNIFRAWIVHHFPRESRALGLSS
ncbi:hypothetical protein ACA910_002426 [Epithemia clementina (nom. ined.)]